MDGREGPEPLEAQELESARSTSVTLLFRALILAVRLFAVYTRSKLDLRKEEIRQDPEGESPTFIFYLTVFRARVVAGSKVDEGVRRTWDLAYMSIRTIFMFLRCSGSCVRNPPMGV